MEPIEVLESTLEPGWFLHQEGAGLDHNYEWDNPDYAYIFKKEEDAQATCWLLNILLTSEGFTAMDDKWVEFTSLPNLTSPQLKAINRYLKWRENASRRHSN